MCLKEAIEIADDGERDQFLSQGYTGEFSYLQKSLQIVRYSYF